MIYEGPETYETMQVRTMPGHHLSRMIPIDHGGVIRLYPLGDDGILHLPKGLRT